MRNHFANELRNSNMAFSELFKLVGEDRIQDALAELHELRMEVKELKKNGKPNPKD